MKLFTKIATSAVLLTTTAGAGYFFLSKDATASASQLQTEYYQELKEENLDKHKTVYLNNQKHNLAEQNRLNKIQNAKNLIKAAKESLNSDDLNKAMEAVNSLNDKELTAQVSEIDSEIKQKAKQTEEQKAKLAKEAKQAEEQKAISATVDVSTSQNKTESSSSSTTASSTPSASTASSGYSITGQYVDINSSQDYINSHSDWAFSKGLHETFSYNTAEQTYEQAFAQHSVKGIYGAAHNYKGGAILFNLSIGSKITALGSSWTVVGIDSVQLNSSTEWAYLMSLGSNQMLLQTCEYSGNNQIRIVIVTKG